ncbi:Ig-like domain-containing protein [Vibrio apostichopi]|uniref:Ig-like domain-containing protein n=1 Tax=Vibrio apostichopi TaxID=3035453 RepID=UPI002574015A|nr:hypothetical protein [Vibrio sp. FE10]
MNFSRIYNRKVGLGIILAISFTLIGCKGGNNDENTSKNDDSTINTYGTLSAQDATFSSGFVESYEVDLSSKVFSSSGGGFSLTDVEVLSDDNQCQIQSITQTGFVISGVNAKVCNYRYHASPIASTLLMHNAQSTEADLAGVTSSVAIARVAFSSEPTATELMPISSTGLINEEIHVSLKEELEKVGINLSEEFVLTEVTSAYDYSSTVQVNSVDSQVIVYTPALDFSGIDRVLYTLEDSSNGLVFMGVLDIAVAYELNFGFTIDEDIVYKDTIIVNTDIDIDIGDYVKSDDEDDYQVVYVGSFNANVASKDPLDISNKIIVFNATSAGYHYISFAVSDHNGVYDMGLIRVSVSDPNQSAKWNDISHLLDLYTSPLTALDAVSKDVPYDTKLIDSAYNPAIDMAGFRYSTSIAYCETIGGTVPTVEQLTQMTSDINVQVLHNWPTQAQYIAYDELTEQPMWVDLSDGAFSSGELDPVEGYYISCVKQGLIEVLPSSDSVVVADGVDVGSVFVELKLGEEVRPDAVITVSVSGSNITLDSDAVTTNIDGIAEFRMTSLKAETVTLTFDVGGILESYDIKFIGDEKTAAVSSEATLKLDGAFFTSVEGNQVIATLVDQNSNLVEGYSVQTEVSSELHPDTGESVVPIIVEVDAKTDVNGEQITRFKWDPTYATPGTDMAFDVTSSYITTTNTETNNVSQVVFTSYTCGGTANDDDMFSATNICVKIAKADGKLFTGTPNINFLNSLNYDGYSATFKENNNNGPKGQDAEVPFARFTYSEAENLCVFYNSLNLYGRSDWAVPDYDELFNLYETYGSLYTSKGWATWYRYWTSSVYNANQNYFMRIRNGDGGASNKNDSVYASCVSRN